MARPREFDEAAALEAATQRFWRYGYEATSVRDLSEATGLTLASLYNAFGDKRSLYRRVLERILGQPPSHRELLDYLATHFVREQGIGHLLPRPNVEVARLKSCDHSLDETVLLWSWGAGRHSSLRK